MGRQTPVLFTIGHSTHPLEEFIALLKQHGVSAIVDVRSQPYSRTEHFCREQLAVALRGEGIDYSFMGRELGARRDEPECYDRGQAAYDKVAELPVFRGALKQVRQRADEGTLAIMCAEKEPLDCHRSILICRHLRGLGLGLRHILADGTVEDHEQTERRLVRQMGVEANLFEPNVSQAELIDQAYDQRGREIAYRSDSQEVAQ